MHPTTKQDNSYVIDGVSFGIGYSIGAVGDEVVQLARAGELNRDMLAKQRALWLAIHACTVGYSESIAAAYVEFIGLHRQVEHLKTMVELAVCQRLGGFLPLRFEFPLLGPPVMRTRLATNEDSLVLNAARVSRNCGFSAQYAEIRALAMAFGKVYDTRDISGIHINPEGDAALGAPTCRLVNPPNSEGVWEGLVNSLTYMLNTGGIKYLLSASERSGYIFPPIGIVFDTDYITNHISLVNLRPPAAGVESGSVTTWQMRLLQSHIRAVHAAGSTHLAMVLLRASAALPQGSVTSDNGDCKGFIATYMNENITSLVTRCLKFQVEPETDVVSLQSYSVLLGSTASNLTSDTLRRVLMDQY